MCHTVTAQADRVWPIFRGLSPSRDRVPAHWPLLHVTQPNSLLDHYQIKVTRAGKKKAFKKGFFFLVTKYYKTIHIFILPAYLLQSCWCIHPVNKEWDIAHPTQRSTGQTTILIHTLTLKAAQREKLPHRKIFWLGGCWGGWREHSNLT